LSCAGNKQLKSEKPVFISVDAIHSTENDNLIIVLEFDLRVLQLILELVNFSSKYYLYNFGLNNDHHLKLKIVFYLLQFVYSLLQSSHLEKFNSSSVGILSNTLDILTFFIKHNKELPFHLLSSNTLEKTMSVSLPLSVNVTFSSIICFILINFSNDLSLYCSVLLFLTANLYKSRSFQQEITIQFSKLKLLVSEENNSKSESDILMILCQHALLLPTSKVLSLEVSVCALSLEVLMNLISVENLKLMKEILNKIITQANTDSKGKTLEKSKEKVNNDEGKLESQYFYFCFCHSSIRKNFLNFMYRIQLVDTLRQLKDSNTEILECSDEVLERIEKSILICEDEDESSNKFSHTSSFNFQSFLVLFYEMISTYNTCLSELASFCIATGKIPDDANFIKADAEVGVFY
jgi:hypothetical protein